MNAYDKPLCVSDACPAPIFSFNKPWREKADNRGVDGFQPDQAAAKRNEEKLPNQLLTNSATRRLLKIPSLTEHQELKERRNMDPVKRGFQSKVHTFLQPSAMYSKRLPQQHVHRVHRRSAQQVADITSEPFKMLASRLAEHHKLVPVKEKVIKALQTSNVKEQQLSQQMDYDDILFPVLNHPFDHLVYYPWELKKKQAMMRAGIYAAMDAHCSRVRLYRLGITQAALGRMDVGIYKNRHWAVKVPLADPIPMEDHARWRYLISADGQGASWRLAKLLAINSVILKAKSDSIEYYYRSLQKDVHYISVDETDILDVLDTLDNSTDSRLKEITDSAQSFAYRCVHKSHKSIFMISFAIMRLDP
ncbi:hypothetical protein CEUSTIGMA_g5205.t1 [Chlamydomonas eustigma]|uniref:Glycosyl transferase CAP10 domain-containing protein n=1 Tax=Chlamydomonas eustigma TaxID=1157962 RepID=A0A250X4E3_9CHLO|nr:hypothetical protein CEUSTIGMA_g5205.t1 [Chlamydomonas eustigma]|eukprot:GAX77762.1 hypothetical protein CEUSTIGMA_g5205.t1 [Chlamydomonas eustigma]